MPTAIFDVDLCHPLPETGVPERYNQAFILVRVAGRPVGTTHLPLTDGRMDAEALRRALMEVGGWALLEHRAGAWLGSADAAPPVRSRATVAICTRDRPDDLRACLNGLAALPDDGQEILVVDNAPSSDATRALVATYPGVRYVIEERPGLDCARNRALREARHEIVAFTDDDSVPDPGWLRALLLPFADPNVGCVTGITMPLELETEAQEWFERMSTFSRGFKRRTFDLVGGHDPLAAGGVGAGVNMAVRRAVLEDVGPFVEALDAGTPTQSGGDHEMMSRILRNGYRIVYEPAALNWHRHRRSWEALKRTLYGYGVGVYAGFTHLVIEYREWGVLRLAWGWFRYSHGPNLLRILLRRPSAPRASLVFAELRGCLAGPGAYFRSRQRYPHPTEGLRG